MRLLMALVFLIAIPASSVQAFEFEKLFLPGDVILGHKKLENECKNCHSRLSDTTQRQLASIVMSRSKKISVRRRGSTAAIKMRFR